MARWPDDSMARWPDDSMARRGLPDGNACYPTWTHVQNPFQYQAGDTMAWSTTRWPVHNDVVRITCQRPEMQRTGCEVGAGMAAQGRFGKQRASVLGGPRRGPMSLAVGETHGNDVPQRIANPEGVEFGLAPVAGFDPFGVDGNLLGGLYPWVSPTANDIVPLRGTWTIASRLSFLGYQGEPGRRQ